MVTIRGVFLLFLAAEVSSVSIGGTTLRKTRQVGPVEICKAEPVYGYCNITINDCFGDNPTTGPYPTCTCTCKKSKENPVEVCCDTKTVGDYSYTKVHYGSGKVPSNCLNDCVYTRDDKPGSKYCFASGEQEVHCLDDVVPVYPIRNMAWNGVVVDSVSAGNFKECAEKCQKTEGLGRCEGWTFTQLVFPGRCTMYNPRGELVKDIFAVSGKRFEDGVPSNGINYGACPPTNNQPTIPMPVFTCPLKDIGFNGPCRLQTNISDWSTCALMCHQDPSCNFWSYQTNGTGRQGPWGNKGDCWFQIYLTESFNVAPGRIAGTSDCITGGYKNTCFAGAEQLTSGACTSDCSEGGVGNCKTCLTANLPNECLAVDDISDCLGCAAEVAVYTPICILDNTHVRFGIPPWYVDWSAALRCIIDKVTADCEKCACDLACDIDSSFCGLC